MPGKHPNFWSFFLHIYLVNVIIRARLVRRSAHAPRVSEGEDSSETFMRRFCPRYTDLWFQPARLIGATARETPASFVWECGAYAASLIHSGNARLTLRDAGKKPLCEPRNRRPLTVRNSQSKSRNVLAPRRLRGELGRDSRTTAGETPAGLSHGSARVVKT
jgi:hypothetical protein